MQKVLTAAQMREVDRLTTERYGIPAILLMENAANAVARVITEKLGGAVEGKEILILCGKGNNGGDGAAVGRILAGEGAVVSVELFGRLDETEGDARVNFERLQAVNGLKFKEVIPEVGDHGVDGWMDNSDYDVVDVLVDALFGTGLTRSLGGFFEAQMDILNQWKRIHGRPFFLSIDIPSGLNSDLAAPPGVYFCPDLTVTFTAPKPANIVPPASSSTSELVIADIGSPHELINEQPSKLYLAEKEDAAEWLEKTAFSASDYKNKRGHALIVAGSEDYSGAAVLAGNAAMRSGVGLVTLACPADTKAEIASRLLPEVILSAIESDELGGHLEKADAIAVGCGLDANDIAVEGLVREIVRNRKVPVIVDAGALQFSNRDAENHPVGEMPPPLLRKEGSHDVPLILTPHEGEFLRLLGADDKEAIQDRVVAVREFATTNNVILVLKGERVLIGHPDGRVVVNPTGNSGLGKAGNGDTLTGILTGFVAQVVKMDIDVFETVVAAVYLAGMAGDVAEKKYGKRVMTASDVRECLTEVFAEFEGKR